jgi:hypothetical protein
LNEIFKQLKKSDDTPTAIQRVATNMEEAKEEDKPVEVEDQEDKMSDQEAEIDKEINEIDGHIKMAKEHNYEHEDSSMKDEEKKEDVK